MFYQDWDKFYYPGLENWYHVPAPQYQAQQAPQYHYRFVKKMSCEHCLHLQIFPKDLEGSSQKTNILLKKMKLLLDSRMQK